MTKGLRKMIIPIISIVLCLSFLFCACAAPVSDGSEHGGESNGSLVDDEHASATTPDSDLNTHEHDLSLVPAVAPECTHGGAIAHWTCSTCGDDFADAFAKQPLTADDIFLPETGHSYKEIVVAPTCTDDGYTLHECSVCGDHFTDNMSDKLGHDFSETISETAPTCTTDGMRKIKCSRCDKIVVETSSSLGHDYVETVVPSACTVGGEVRNTCSRCGDVVVESLLPAGHSYKEIVVPPTCTADGYTLHECSVCGDHFTDNVTEKLGHDFTETISETAPTCTDDGVRKIKCSRCDEATTEVLHAAGHAYTETVTEPTCIADGYTVHKCSVCGHEYSDCIVAARGHEYSAEWSCDDDGHWHNVTCGCDVAVEKVAHSFADGRCDVCGMERAWTYELEFAETDGGFTVTGIAVSTQVESMSLDVVIPSEHDGKAVVAIADGAFENNKFMKSVFIPSTVKRIGKGAFSGCSIDSAELESTDGWKSARTASASNGTRITWGKPSQIADSLKAEYKNFYLFCV